MTDTTPLTGFDGVEAILNRIAADSTERPAIRLLTASAALAHLTLWTTGKNAGSVTVDLDGAWLGLIKDGVWSPSPVVRALPDEAKRDLEALFQDLKADPEKVCADFGRKIGRCSVCGRRLSRAESVTLGMGAECRKRAFGGAV